MAIAIAWARGMDVDDYLFETPWKKIAEDLAAYQLINGLGDTQPAPQKNIKRAL